MPEKCNIVIVIVDYFKAERVVENVLSILEQNDCPKNVIITITDNSCDHNNKIKLLQLSSHDNVHLHFNDKNNGYIDACNNAVKPYNANYIILVNPDIAWKNKTTLSELIRLMDTNPDFGILGPRQINDDGTTPSTIRGFPNLMAQIARRTILRRLPFFKTLVNNYELTNFDYSKSQTVDWIQSSLLVVRGELWNKLGGLDKSYFLFMSDPDICFKAWENNYKVFYTAESFVGADGKRCSEGGLLSFFTSKALRHHFIDASKYQLKYLFRIQPSSDMYMNTTRKK